MPELCLEKIGAEGETRTPTGFIPTVFETAASTIPPLRHEEILIIGCY